MLQNPSDLAIEQLCSAIERGELRFPDLTARRVSTYLGRTTSFVYHHFGSLEALLYAVAQAGFARLAARWRPGQSLADIAEGFISFGHDHPELYRLMFEHYYEWQALREAGALTSGKGMAVWSGLVARFSESAQPEDDARAFYAGLHGLVSLANSGRANVGDLSLSDREAAIRAGRRLASLFCLEH